MENKPALRVLVNSMPKSGTSLLIKTVHLLGYQNADAKKGIFQKMLYGIGFKTPSTLNHQTVSRNRLFCIYRLCNKNNQISIIPIGVNKPIHVPSRIVALWLRQVPDRNFITGHIPWSSNLDRVLQQFNYKHVLIIRDPRDVLVSWLHYVLKPGHPVRCDFIHFSEDEMVEFAIKGGYLPLSKRNFIGIGDVFRSVLNWKQSANCLIVRFEDLIGEKGGGSKDDQYCTVQNICNFLEVNLSETELSTVCDNIFDTTVPTFRRGQVGSWKSELKPEWIKIFNQSNSELLNELRYK
jgi:hypothetical protein